MSSSSESDRLFDAYLDALLAGEAEDPEAFLAKRGAAGEELLRKLEALYETARPRSRGGSAGGAAGIEAEDGLPFKRLGDFRLLRRLAAGGMGTVYLAEQESLGRVVALKVIRPENVSSPTAVERFRREARALARVQHPHIVAVHGCGEDDGVHWMAMELVPGLDLAETLYRRCEEGKPVPPSTAVRWASEIARALACVHAEGIVHRDVKASNVRITPRGKAVLVDFGLAREEDSGLTVTRSFAGSPAYASPEQVRGEKLDARSDLYSLGVTLYECLTGRQPFHGPNVDAIFHRVLTRDPPPPRSLNHGIPRDLELVVMKALEKDPERRYPTARAFADDLDAVLEFRPIQARAPGLGRRLLQWARRHRAASAAAVTAGTAVLAGAIYLGLDAHLEQLQERQEAQHLVVAARDRIETFRRDREALRDREQLVLRIETQFQQGYATPEEVAKLDRAEREVAAARLRRESTYHEVLDLLDRAERLFPRIQGTDLVRAELNLEKVREALELGDTATADFYDRLAAQHDDGSVRQRLYPVGDLRIGIRPPGDTELWLFREREYFEVVDGGEPRLVHVPVGEAELPADPGRAVLRVLRDGPGVLADDLILELGGEPVRHPAAAMASAAAGGITARLLRQGTWREVELAPGILLRPSSSPLLLMPENRRVVDGVAVIENLPSGYYLAFFRRPGFRSQRLPLSIQAEAVDQRWVELAPLDSAPVDFVPIVARAADPPGRFWMQDHEVTSGEYLEFLESPEIRARIAAGMEPPLVPRTAESAADGGFWPVDPDGVRRLPSNWDPQWPVIGISWFDAEAYAAWRTERARAEGRNWRFRLPTRSDIYNVGSGYAPRRYSYGDRFRPHWSNNCFSRPRPQQEPVFSYPIDESCYGIYDLCGGALEWLDTWWDPEQTARHASGGGWLQGGPIANKLAAGIGYPPNATTAETGLRLVLEADSGSDID